MHGETVERGGSDKNQFLLAGHKSAVLHESEGYHSDVIPEFIDDQEGESSQDLGWNHSGIRMQRSATDVEHELSFDEVLFRKPGVASAKDFRHTENSSYPGGMRRPARSLQQN